MTSLHDRHNTFSLNMMESGVDEGSIVYSLGFPMNLVDAYKNRFVDMDVFQEYQMRFYVRKMRTFILSMYIVFLVIQEGLLLISPKI